MPRIVAQASDFSLPPTAQEFLADFRDQDFHRFRHAPAFRRALVASRAKARRDDERSDRPYFTVMAIPLRSALTCRPTCLPVSSSWAPLSLVMTITWAPLPTAPPPPAAP